MKCVLVRIGWSCLAFLILFLAPSPLIMAQDIKRVEVYVDVPTTASVVVNNGNPQMIPGTLFLIPDQTYHIRATSSGYMPWEQDIWIDEHTTEIVIDMELAPGWKIVFDFAEYDQNYEGGLRWENDSIIFSASIGLPINSQYRVWGGLSAPTPVWYRFWPDEQRLEQFNISPYLIYPRLPLETLSTLLVSQWGQYIFDLVYPSPTGNEVIYPRTDGAFFPALENAETRYWFSDLETGSAVNLEISASAGYDFPVLNTFWFPGENQVVAQSVFGLHPKPVLIDIDTTRVTVTPLIEIYPWTKFDSDLYSLRFIALSPSGQHMVVAVQSRVSDPFNLMLYDGARDELISLGQYEFGFDPTAVWLDDNNLLAVTPLGVIEYNLTQQAATTLVNIDLLVPQTMGTCLINPDGGYLFLHKFRTDESNTSTILMYELD